MDEVRPRAGRPRSEQARQAVLHAVDDLLVEVGYAALTMKGIAERAGVGRQTIYRWWSTKAEVLFEAAITDAAKELGDTPRATTIDDVVAYLDGAERFLTTSPAGVAYRVLVGEAQHDPEVARLLGSAALFDRPVDGVLTRGIERGDIAPAVPFAEAAAILTGPVFYRALTGAGGPVVPTGVLAAALLAAVQDLAHRHQETA
ncbi:TetR/AcrR family transcriptional regulator [Lentzea sp. JNUCC 0626]|uniref:TetR/AcrR family transcriptional regulator n=1 Tax=Lentzea sp. JNUCC 0626 TaxID=3367513 RepID=UPI00374A703F